MGYHPALERKGWTFSPMAPYLKSVTPILSVRDVTAAAGFYTAKLGFQTDFLYGEPPFYGSVSREEVCLHLGSWGGPTLPSWPHARPR
jgi:hypothetical protein